MSDHTQELVDAKLAAAEARTETRISEISGEIKLLASSINAMSEKVVEANREQRSTRITIIVTAIGVVIGIVAAVWQMQTGLLDALQTGLSVNQAKQTHEQQK